MGPEAVTELLLRWRAGDQEYLHRLLPRMEGELRRIAHRYIRMERQGHTLQTTPLVNEAYLKLVDPGKGGLADPRALPGRGGPADAAYLGGSSREVGEP